VNAPARFLTPLDVRVLENRHKLLLADLVFYSADLRGLLIAPRGMQTDFASTPRIAWSIFPKDGPWSWAAVMHDGAYIGALVTADGERIRLIKPVADKLFYEAMGACGVNGAAKRVMYALVSAFGTMRERP